MPPNSEYKDEFNDHLIGEYQSKSDQRPIRKTTSVGPSVIDKTWHTHTSGPIDYKIMTESNAAQQYIKSNFY